MHANGEAAVAPPWGEFNGIGAMLAILASENFWTCCFEPSQVKGLLKMASWTAPGSIVEAPRIDFEGSGDHFFEIFGFLAGKMLVANFVEAQLFLVYR